MNIVEAYPYFSNEIPKLTLTAPYTNKDSTTPYVASQLVKLKDVISRISTVPYVTDEIQQLFSSWLFQTTLDSISLNAQQKGEVDRILETLRIKLLLLKDIAESTNVIGENDLIYVRFPDFNSFDELSRISNELKKGIEIPIVNDTINGRVKIVSADKGSIIFYVSLGTIAAVKVIGNICWSAAVIRKKTAEAKIFEAQARTLELKNEALENIIDSQKIQLKNILDSEAASIAAKNYSHSDPETIERLKMSISSISELIDRGAKIEPLSNDENVKKTFPDYSKLNLIESTIKQLKDGAQNQI